MRDREPTLIVVRHAQPRIDPTAPPASWPLTDRGRESAARLAERLAGLGPTAAVSSPEPKALETTQIIARRLDLAVATDVGFAEHHRPELPFGDRAEFEARMARLFAAPAEPFFGGESADAAEARFAAAVSRFTQRPLLVGTHGTVLSLYVARRAGLDPFELWRSLALPEALVLAADGTLLVRIA